MKIAIFGGSFNPVHVEHVNIVKAAVRAISPDKIIIIPSNMTPAKSGRLTASGEHRLNMCGLSFGAIKNAEVSDCEIKRGGVSYSYLTCRELRGEYPADELFFIVGADMLENFPHWKNPKEILKCVTLAACARENASGLEAAEKTFKNTFGKDIVKFGYIGAKVSSTKIRALAALGESTEEFVTPDTSRYISENSLYSIKNIKEVKKYLTPERFAHTVRVAVMSAENCSRFNISEEKAITAAALHDCAKYLNSDSPELKGFICPDGVPAPVVHQYSGAFVAEHTFGVDDSEILDAIKYHTSGKENLSPLGKLLFLCDMLEEGRNFDGIREIRELFKTDMDGALYVALERQIRYLESTGKPIYPLTRNAYAYIKHNYIKENKNEQ